MSRNKSSNILSTEQHWKFFTEFCKYEVASGGPDPQITLVGEMSRDVDLAERVWRGGCYICVYNVPFAEVLWHNWPWDSVLNSDDLLPWITQHWDGIKTRVERKSVRIKANMVTFLMDYANYILSDSFNVIMESTEDPELLYDKIFYDCQKVKFLGRYVALKLVEYLRKYCGLMVTTPDIRPIGAWSPRKTLSVLWPGKSDSLLSGDKPENVTAVNAVVDDTILKLDDLGVSIDKFQLQVMLCEYRESYESMRQYPGRSHDSELGYWNKAANYWKESYTERSTMFEVRKSVFPNEHLGEIQGWPGARNDCGGVLATYGYTWTDLMYDYTKSLCDLGSPVHR